MKRVLNLLFIVLLLITFTSCKKQEKIEYGNKELSIFVTSDTHLLSDELVKNMPNLKSTMTSDGRIQKYDIELVESLVKEVNEKKPEYLIITGDLTFNGEKKSHEKLISLLNQITDTKVLVIPGNHDVYNINANDYSDNKVTETDHITYEEFYSMYYNFGFDKALSLDTESLSYIYPLSETKWALMLDTTMSLYNFENHSNATGGMLDIITCDWLEENLKYAQENNIEVISFSHHNLIMHNENFTNLYTIRNSKYILEIYKKYNVNLHFSGHLHIQNISESDGIYDIASSGLLDYGNRYGRVDIYDNLIEYKTNHLSIDGINLQKESFDKFYQCYYKKHASQYKEKYGDKNGETFADLVCKVNSYYFDGDYIKINELVKQNKRLLSKIDDINSYNKSILNVQNKDQNYLLLWK